MESKPQTDHGAKAKKPPTDFIRRNKERVKACTKPKPQEVENVQQKAAVKPVKSKPIKPLSQPDVNLANTMRSIAVQHPTPSKPVTPAPELEQCIATVTIEESKSPPDTESQVFDTVQEAAQDCPVLEEEGKAGEGGNVIAVEPCSKRARESEPSQSLSAYSSPNAKRLKRLSNPN